MSNGQTAVVPGRGHQQGLSKVTTRGDAGAAGQAAHRCTSPGGSQLRDMRRPGCPGAATWAPRGRRPPTHSQSAVALTAFPVSAGKRNAASCRGSFWEADVRRPRRSSCSGSPSAAGPCSQGGSPFQSPGPAARRPHVDDTVLAGPFPRGPRGPSQRLQGSGSCLTLVLGGHGGAERPGRFQHVQTRGPISCQFSYSAARDGVLLPLPAHVHSRAASPPSSQTPSSSRPRSQQPTRLVSRARADALSSLSPYPGVSLF